MYCRNAAVILASRFDLDGDYISSLVPADAWSIVRSRRQQKAVREGLQICFRGFGARRRSALLKAVDQHRHLVAARNLGRRVDFLCVGNVRDTGLLTRAFELGIQLLTEQQFYLLVSTGEVDHDTVCLCQPGLPA